jgi:hypothetical protein
MMALLVSSTDGAFGGGAVVAPVVSMTIRGSPDSGSVMTCGCGTDVETTPRVMVIGGTWLVSAGASSRRNAE